MSLIMGGLGTRRTRSGFSLSSALSAEVKTLTSQAVAGSMISLLENVTGLRFDPAPTYLFNVELEGIVVALFTECEGLEVERDIEKWEEGGNNSFVHKLPGRCKYDNIVLKRGLSLSQALWRWFETGLYDFDVQRINFSIIQGAPGYNLATALAGITGLADPGGSDAQQTVFGLTGKGFGKVKHWNVEDAFPVSWKASSLNVSGKDTVIEEVKIAHHGLELSYEVGTPMSIGASLAGGVTGAIPMP